MTRLGVVGIRNRNSSASSRRRIELNNVDSACVLSRRNVARPMMWLNAGMQLGAWWKACARKPVVPQPPPHFRSPDTVRNFTFNPHFIAVLGRELALFLGALMRYIRFLKTPRVVVEKGTQRKQILCLITVTSDLGDSFLPYDVQLSAELLSSRPTEKVIAWKNIQWSAGMRSLPVTFPLITSLGSSGFRVKVGVEPKSTHDEYSKLSDEGTCSVVSAWTSEFDPFAAHDNAEKLVERRFKLSNGLDITICEETGESIARHLW
jgi:hypothetical protein